MKQLFPRVKSNFFQLIFFSVINDTDIFMGKRKNFDSYLRQLRKINLRKTMDLNVKSQIQEKIEHFHNLG